MNRILRLILCVLSILLAVYPAASLAGDSTEVQLARAASGPGHAAIIAGAVAWPLLSGDEESATQALRAADGILSAWLVAQGLQQLTHQQRPDGSGDDSFPSGHATAAFAAASMAADDRPEQAPYWYGAAAVIAWSRVRLKRHRVRDVLAGAALGIGMASLERSLPRGLLLAPFIDADRGCGVEAVWEF